MTDLWLRRRARELLDASGYDGPRLMPRTLPHEEQSLTGVSLEAGQPYPTAAIRAARHMGREMLDE